MARALLIACCAAAFLLCALHPATGGEVRIYRDGWGVPHIYGDAETDVMYGFGYAQAEDRLEAVLKNYLTATGRMAEAFGPDYIDGDFHQRLWRHGEIGRERYADQSAHVRALVESFIAGVVASMRAHPHRVPDWAFEPEPHHVLALGRYIAWQEMERQADREYRGEESARTGHRSNQWAVGRERSAEDAVVLCIDPHRRWDGPDRWYEAHLHGGALNAFGFTHPGLPVFLVGHNDHLGWSAAPGGPDAADVYEIELDSATASRYRYDGGWKPIRTRTIRIEVKNGGRVETRLRRMQRTHHGPILHRSGARAYAYRLAVEDGAGQVEQLYRQMTATNLREFYAALDLAQIGPTRIVYGDVYGNTFHIRTGRVPIRSEVYQWDRPLPGNISATEWMGVHSQDDLIQIRNPSQGWLQDCGTSPDLVTPAGPLTPDRYPDYIYNDAPDTASPRSVRARQLLAALSRITLQEAFDLALDTYVVGSERWQRALAEAHNSIVFRALHPDLEDAVRVLNRWNGRADRDQVGMALYARWQRTCRQRKWAVNARHILSRQKLGRDTCLGLLESLEEAARGLKSDYGRLEVPWREINRIRRGGRSWGLSGSSGKGLEVLRTVETVPDGKIGYGVSGQSCTTVVLFRAPGQVESFSAVPFGQSDRPASPHTWDQAEALFGRERLKPNGYRRAGAPFPSGLKLQETLTPSTKK